MPDTKRQAKERLLEEIGETARAHGMETLHGRDLVELLSAQEGLIAWAARDILVRRGRDSVPALLAGLSHPLGKIRASCALLLDHVADDRCVEPLLRAIQQDPVEAVRRCALHSLVCDGCKECPLTTDVIGALMETALQDRSVSVRRRAVFYLSMQQPDFRIAPFLQDLLARESDSILRQRAQNALRQHVASVSAI